MRTPIIENQAQRLLTRTTISFNQTPNSYWFERLMEAARAVQEEAAVAASERESRYLEMMAREPSWIDDASYAAYQSLD